MMRVADYVMQFLVSKGVREVFMLSGGGAMFLDDALGHCKQLKYTCFLHEQALAIACEAYGQYTNTPGVGLVTSGPGATNTITGVAAAWIDSTPCLFISGQAKRQTLMGKSGVRQMGSQEVDIISMVSCITKRAVTIMKPEEIRYHLENLWYEATSGRMGPVWLDIPLDVQSSVVDETSLEGFIPEPIVSSLQLPLTQVVEELSSAKNPLILVGNGVKLSGGNTLLRTFAEQHQIPMLLTWKMADFLGFDHPLNFGSPGGIGSRYANFIVQNCDLLLILGCRLDPSITAFNPEHFAFKAFKIMVDIDPAEMKKIPGVDLQIQSDAAEFLRQLAAADPTIAPHPEWLTYCQCLKERYPVTITKNYNGDDASVDLYRFTEVLFECSAPEDVIVPESSGSAGEVTYQAMCVKAGQRIKNAAGLGSMGFGLPYAIGACLACDRTRTILINGDGAFQLNIQELETAHRLRLPIKMFIFDNAGYGTIANTQNNLFNGFHVGADRDSGLTLPDICKVAAAYGLQTFEIRNNGELESQIKRVLASEGPVLCRIFVRSDHKILPRVQSQKLPDGTMISKPLEDMWPYLPEDEMGTVMKGPER